jgi:hypothetical protein
VFAERKECGNLQGLVKSSIFVMFFKIFLSIKEKFQVAIKELKDHTSPPFPFSISLLGLVVVDRWN